MHMDIHGWTHMHKYTHNHRHNSNADILCHRVIIMEKPQHQQGLRMHLLSLHHHHDGNMNISTKFYGSLSS